MSDKKKKVNGLSIAKRDYLEPFEFASIFSAKDHAPRVVGSPKLEAVIAPVIVLDGTAAVTMAAQSPLITQEALYQYREDGTVPNLGASLSAIRELDNEGEVFVVDQPDIPASLVKSPLLEIVGDGGMGFERNTSAAAMVDQAAVTLVPRTMMTDLSVRHCGPWFGLAKFPTMKTRLARTKNQSTLDVRVWEASIRALHHGHQLPALRREFNFEDQEAVKRGVSAYLATELMLVLIHLAVKTKQKPKLFTESGMQIDFTVRETPIEMTHNHTIQTWPVKAVSESETCVTVEVFEGLQVTATLDISGRTKSLKKADFPVFRQSVWNSAIHSAGDDVVKMMYSGNRCLMKCMLLASVRKYLDENRSTLIVSWRNPGASLSTELGYMSDGSMSTLDSVAAGFEKSYDTLTQEISDEHGHDLDTIKKAVAVISHRTKDAIGSNAYSAYNDIVIIGEPYKPSDAVTMDRSWQGNQLTARNDMLAALLQSIGRGVIRQGSASSPRLQNLFLFDMSEEVVGEIASYFDLVTDDVRGSESVAKFYDRLARSLLDFLMGRLKDANDDFVMALRFLTKFGQARKEVQVTVLRADIETIGQYDWEEMSERIRRHCPTFPIINVTEDKRQVTSTIYRNEKNDKIWRSIVMHSVVKQLWTLKHVPAIFDNDIGAFRRTIMGEER